MNARNAFINEGSSFAFCRSFKNAFTVFHLYSFLDFVVIIHITQVLYLNITVKSAEIPLMYVGRGISALFE